MIRALLILAVTGVATAALAAPPQQLQLQGMLRNAAGDAAPDGDYGITVRLFSQETGGDALHTESFGAANEIAIVDGRFSVVLGSLLPLPTAAFTAGATWAEVQVGTEAALPRSRFLSVPYALMAQTADALTCSGCVTAGQLAFQTVTPTELAAAVTPLAGLDSANTFSKLQTFDAGIAVTGPIAGLTAENATGDAIECGPTALGRLYFDTSEDRLRLCTAAGWRWITVCDDACPALDQVACGEASTDTCGGDCPGVGSGPSPAQCFAAVGTTECAAPVTDACGNECGLTGTLCPNQTGCTPSGCTAYGSAELPGVTCKDILEKVPDAESGLYTIDVDGDDGAAPFQVFCDMKVDGGGWTLVAKVHRHHGQNLDEPNNWFSTTRDTAALLDTVSYEDRVPGQASFGASRLTPLGNKSTLARFVFVAEDDPLQTVRFFKNTGEGLVHWMSKTGHPATLVCTDVGMTQSCELGDTQSDGLTTNLDGMEMAKVGFTGGTWHMRLNDDESPSFSAMCSSTSDADNNAWHDSTSSHWGNGMAIWLR